MARQDDYFNAARIAKEMLAQKHFDDIRLRTGFSSPEDNVFHISFLDKKFRVTYPDFEFTVDPHAPDVKDAPPPIQEQVLILHYMMGAIDRPLSDNWIAYREIKDASFYFNVFVKRAIDPLKKVFGANIDGFSKIAGKLGGTSLKFGDAGFEFFLFPRIPLHLILWEGDEEFPPEANILFNDTIAGMLSGEDIAWLSGFLVYRMIALFYQR